jgi:glycosyltransferase involved in cell wall biosynthesis
MARQSTVSVLMPSFNYERYLPLAVNSVLAQTFSDLELIIVDDCSSDGSRAIAENYARVDDRVRTVFHTVNRGLAATRNTALAASSGKFIALCDADDIWLPEKLEHQLDAFRGREELGLVHSDALIMDAKGCLSGQQFSRLFHRKNQRTSGDLFDELCRRNFICVPSVVLRREAILYAGGFEERLRSLEDWVCWTKVSRNYQFEYIDAALVHYRMHSASLSHNSEGMARNRIIALDLLLESLSDIAPKPLSRLYYSLGMSHLELGELRAALVAFDNSLTTHPVQLRAWLRFCQCCVNIAIPHASRAS